MFHLMAVHGAETGEVSYETDRMRFLGRGNTVTDPQAMRGSGALSGSMGSVLDPIVSVRRRITLDPEESATIDIVSGACESRDAAVSLAGKYQDRRNSSTPRKPTRSSTDTLPAPSSMPIPLCAPTRAFSSGTAAGNPACGAIPFPATCRSCWCRSEIR
jgi:cellobiose phosphorylase